MTSSWRWRPFRQTFASPSRRLRPSPTGTNTSLAGTTRRRRKTPASSGEENPASWRARRVLGPHNGGWTSKTPVLRHRAPAAHPAPVRATVARIIRGCKASSAGLQVHDLPKGTARTSARHSRTMTTTTTTISLQAAIHMSVASILSPRRNTPG